MKKSLIGINPYYFHYQDSFWNGTKELYYQAVWAGGGVPVTLHYADKGGCVEDIAEKINGLLMVGGPDLLPQVYKGINPDLPDEEVVHPKRENFDRAIFLAMKALGKPILSICAGFQLINIIYGGTLFEDLKTQMKGSICHGEPNGSWSEHTVELKEGSLIRDVMGVSRTVVASTHHQGIRKLGKGLNAVGHAENGLIEAIEDSTQADNFIALQWHPEITLERKEQVRLFQWLS